MPWLLTREFSCPAWNWRDRILKADKNNSESFMYESVCEERFKVWKTHGVYVCMYAFIYLFHIGNTCRCFSLWETGCLLGHNRKQ